MIIARKIYPTYARFLCQEHNKDFHNGVPTANIVVYNKYSVDGRPPFYMVICKECDGKSGES